jgi:D-alanyl-D-alanine endopeptidase (penicillin-binding protein 7)
LTGLPGRHGAAAAHREEEPLKLLLHLVVIALALALPAVAPAQQRGEAAKSGTLQLKSAAALVLDQGGQVLYAKNVHAVVPIASLTKLMTALVVVESGQALAESIAIDAEDVDDLKYTRSRLRIGTVLTRGDLLKLALMASENRAAAALARAHPGGKPAFVAAMNEKAAVLGMPHTHFVDSTGLSSQNVSTAVDLARLAAAAYRQPLIREYTTETSHTIELANGRQVQYGNSNRLVNNTGWDIGLSKTGYLSEAGRCLVMQAKISTRPVIIVLLDSWGKLTRIGDANRIKKWIETQALRQPAS